MAVLIILLSLVIVAIVLMFIFKKDWIATIFGNTITSRVEKKKKVENKIEVLKKEQKMKSDKIMADYKAKENELKNTTEAQVNSLKARIKSLEDELKSGKDVLAQEQKVQLDKLFHTYDEKIINQQNLVTRLENSIVAEQKNVEQSINNTQPNKPTQPKILLETKKK